VKKQTDEKEFIHVFCLIELCLYVNGEKKAEVEVNRRRRPTQREKSSSADRGAKRRRQQTKRYKLLVYESAVVGKSVAIYVHLELMGAQKRDTYRVSRSI
jgi:hypothetical protein